MVYAGRMNNVECHLGKSWTPSCILARPTGHIGIHGNESHLAVLENRVPYNYGVRKKKPPKTLQGMQMSSVATLFSVAQRTRPVSNGRRIFTISLPQ